MILTLLLFLSVAQINTLPATNYLTLNEKIKKISSMAKKEFPVTPAIRLLRARKIDFKPYLYAYKAHGGALHAAEALDIPEDQVVKTLVMETDSNRSLLVLMHGNRDVSTKALARKLGVKRISPCSEIEARKNTGYKVGGISPLATRKRMPVYVEASILTLEKIYLNGGKRGFMIEIDPRDLCKVLKAEEVEVAI